MTLTEHRRPNGLFILLDSVRYDVLADPDAVRELFPNLAELLKNGRVARVVTNAQATQFVLPSLFSLTYPLDHGGYNAGIRNRPKSFVEVLHAAGYTTQMITNCNQLGVTMGYDRGFQSIASTSDFRTILQQSIERNIEYEIGLWRKGEYTEAEMLAVLTREYRHLLQNVLVAYETQDRSIWPPALAEMNHRVAEGCRSEIDLFDRDPHAVLAKLQSIPPGVYWTFLGHVRPAWLTLWRRRIVEGAAWRLRKAVTKQSLWPFLLLSHYPVLIRQVLDRACATLAANRGNPWFTYLHIMDIHDCRALNHPLTQLARLRFMPRWLRGRATGGTRRRFLYDAAIMDVDQSIGRILANLRESGQLDNTVIAVTADHGLHYAESPRKKSDISRRTHYEDITVPLLLVNAVAPETKGMLDSMGVTATFLAALGVPLDPSFKGVGLQDGGRACVISEHAGSGNADLRRKDLYFTVTTPDCKLMTVLKGDELQPIALFDLRQDPRELCNLVDEPGRCRVMEELLRYIEAERSELLTMRRNGAEAPVTAALAG